MRAVAVVAHSCALVAPFRGTAWLAPVPAVVAQVRACARIPRVCAVHYAVRASCVCTAFRALHAPALVLRAPLRASPGMFIWRVRALLAASVRALCARLHCDVSRARSLCRTCACLLHAHACAIFRRVWAGTHLRCKPQHKCGCVSACAHVSAPALGAQRVSQSPACRICARALVPFSRVLPCVQVWRMPHAAR